MSLESSDIRHVQVVKFGRGKLGNLKLVRRGLLSDMAV